MAKKKSQSQKDYERQEQERLSRHTPGRKHSDLEIQERRLYLMSLRSQGVKSTRDLHRYFSDKYPHLSKRTFESDLKVVREQIREYYETDKGFEISEIMKHLWELYNKSLKIQDYRECRSILKDISQLKGHLVQKHDVTSEGEQVPVINFIPATAPQEASDGSSNS